VRRSSAVGKPLCSEEFTVHDDCLEHLGHHRPLAAIQNVLLLLGQGHLVGFVGVVLLETSIGAGAGQVIRYGVALMVDPELVAMNVVIRGRIAQFVSSLPLKAGGRKTQTPACQMDHMKLQPPSMGKNWPVWNVPWPSISVATK
jgi:hypothetical protein